MPDTKRTAKASKKSVTANKRDRSKSSQNLSNASDYSKSVASARTEPPKRSPKGGKSRSSARSSSKSKKLPERDEPAEEFESTAASFVASLSSHFAWFSLKESLFLAAAGIVLGLAAPGFDQWYLAWFALAPFFLLFYKEPGLLRRLSLSAIFAMTYNLTYLHWYLNLYPLDWLGFPAFQGAALATLAWIIVAGHQTLIFILYAALIAYLPLTGGFTWRKSGKKLIWPAIPTLSLIWVLIFNKIGNMPDLMGVPWPLLEYTQYNRPDLIQSASIIGGIGISFLIVATNVTLASLLATYIRGSNFKALQAENRESAFYHCLGMGLILGGFYCLGLWQSSETKIQPTVPVTTLQAGINIEMQKADRHYTLDDLTAIYEKLMKNSKNELVVLYEDALPAYLRETPGLQNWLKTRAQEKNIDIVTGAMDRNAIKPYNSAYGITTDGLLDTVYHKRFLVPIGEYTPLLVQYMPEWVKRWTNTPAGNPFAAGKEPGVLELKRAKAAPLICFESISPEVTTASTRAGGDLLVNLSDLAWFHNSDCGKQMIAFGVLRSIENRRYLIFAANSGPSAIIDANGSIIGMTSQGENQTLSGKVGRNSRLTPFAMWYR